MSLARSLIITATVTLLMMVYVEAKPDVGKGFCYCGTQDHPGSDFQMLTEEVSRDLIDQTPRQNYNYYNERNYGEIDAYGHAICKYKMSREDCSSCLHVANIYRIHLCRSVMGSRISLIDCYMRIEDFDFKWDAAEITSII